MNDREQDEIKALATIWGLLWQIGGEVAIWGFHYRFDTFMDDGVLMNMFAGFVAMLAGAFLSGLLLTLLFVESRQS